MKEIPKRTISGISYICIIFFGIYHSESSFRILFIILGLLSLYEILKIRKGKLIPILFVTIPFILIQFLDKETNHFSYESQDSRIFILLIFLVTWTFDTFAYLIGIKFGKNKIMPSVSPKKSWEGFIGGYIAVTIISFYPYNILMYSSEKLQSNFVFNYIGLLIPFTSTIGDFIMSYYKRKASIKDSSNLIPGHGGILDRMDAFLITIPLIYIYLKLAL